MSTDLLDPATAPRQFVHEKCGATSLMADDLVSGYLANPHRFNDWAFCAKCDGFVPHHECHWAESNEKLDAYFGRLKAAVPAPPVPRWLSYTAAAVLIAIGAGIGFGLGGDVGIVVGALVGFGLGMLLMIAHASG